MKLIRIITCLAALALATPVGATEGYIGVGFGESFVDDGAFGETDTGYKIFGGARFNPYVAAEVAYFNLGKPESNFFGIVQTFDVRALAGLLKGIWPVTPRIDLYAKLGAAYWKTDQTLSVFGSPTQRTSRNGVDLAYGVGAAWNVGKRLAVLVEFEDVNGGLDGAALLSAALALRF